MKSTRSIAAFLIGIGLATAASSEAQVSPPGTVFASGLLGPRGLKFGTDGTLYVAEAGSGGTTSSATLPCPQTPAPTGPYLGGATARISAIDSSGNRTTVASGLPSAMNSLPTGDTLGVADIAFLGSTMYAVVAGGGCSHGNPSQPNGIVQVDPATGTWNYIANLSQFLQSHAAAYPDPADFEPDGVFYSMIGHGGKLYTVEPNHGQIFSVTQGGLIEETIDISLSEGHIVPTAITSKGGNLYVGNLGQFPIFTQLERVLTLARGLDSLGIAQTGPFRIADSRAGFTTIVGLDFGPDGLLYALEMSEGAGYPGPGLGKVVRLRSDGVIEDVVTGLTLPAGMTFGPDKALYISNYGAVTGAAGQILRVVVPFVY